MNSGRTRVDHCTAHITSNRLRRLTMPHVIRDVLKETCHFRWVWSPDGWWVDGLIRTVWIHSPNFFQCEFFSGRKDSHNECCNSSYPVSPRVHAIVSQIHLVSVFLSCHQALCAPQLRGLQEMIFMCHSVIVHTRDWLMRRDPEIRPEENTLRNTFFSYLSAGIWRHRITEPPVANTSHHNCGAE